MNLGERFGADLESIILQGSEASCPSKKMLIYSNRGERSAVASHGDLGEPGSSVFSGASPNVPISFSESHSFCIRDLT